MVHIFELGQIEPGAEDKFENSDGESEEGWVETSTSVSGKRKKKPKESARKKKRKTARSANPKPKEPQIRNRRIVGVDFGTTYSGVSLVDALDDIKGVQIIREWPGSEDHKPKIATTIAYQNGKPLWGGQVKPGMQSWSWFKLGMASKECASTEDDPLLQQAVGMSLMKCPPGKTPQTLCKDFLTGLCKHIMTNLGKEFGKALDVTPLEFVFSTPADWGEVYIEKLKRAAREAGFATKPLDGIFTIEEPTAAALLTFEHYRQKPVVQTLFEAKKNILVVDMGGGTVIRPFRVREACQGAGAMCGGTSIDREFHRLMESKYGSVFSGKSAKDISQGSQFMKEFENIKRAFDGEQREYTVCLALDRESGKGYDAELGQISLTREEICNMFRPVLENSFKLALEQIRKCKEENGNPLTAIILCGGLSDNAYVREQFQEFCKAHSEREETQVLVPPNSWSAIATGAALSRISQKPKISSHGEKVRQTYKWLEGYLALDSRGPLKGQLQLYKCKDANPPNYITSDVQLLGSLSLDFSSLLKRTGSRKLQGIKVKIGHRIRTQTGQVEFAHRINGGKPTECTKFEYEAIQESEPPAESDAGDGALDEAESDEYDDDDGLLMGW
ncbi:predicted protein [Uncinocarpus reesii 1704]|uniref:Hsp70-like protein n=1 Tax=Uncinocarpus reesii (strain UAMH 1704) TaxID=336963 RepID=C4JZQ7_UNCRE|nr:uncharacterized protein UREG_07658 [Uncinocarpus reesii 1704]EEP82793.1 predicted protein [Uncinocarpus reesii 1704]